jgi:hypothetical protein
MTTKERLHQLVDMLSDGEAEDAWRLLDAELQAQAQVERHAETAALPEGWGTTLTGEPMPDVVAAVRRSRAAH